MNSRSLILLLIAGLWLSPSYAQHREPLRGYAVPALKNLPDYWYGHWAACLAAAPDPNTFLSYLQFLFPDTLPVVIDSNGNSASSSYHAIGQVLDPTDYNYGLRDPAMEPLGRYTYYHLDSIIVPYVYNRTIDSLNGKLLKDTLFIQYFRSYQLQMGKELKPGSPWQTFARPLIYPRDSFNSLSSFSYKTDTLLLGPEHKCNDLQYRLLKIAPGFDNYRLGPKAFTLLFKPAYPYSANDTLFSFKDKPHKPMNAFAFFQLVNDSSSPQEWQTRYYGNSLFDTRESHYTTPDSFPWQGFVPGHLFSSPHYLYSSFNIFYLQSVASTENKKDLVVYPNPVSSGQRIRIQLPPGFCKNSVKISFTHYSGQLYPGTYCLNCISNTLLLKTELPPGLYTGHISSQYKNSSFTLCVE